MTRVGALRYLNALPLVDGLEREPVFDSVRYEMPSLLAKDLRSGELDATPSRRRARSQSIGGAGHT